MAADIHKVLEWLDILIGDGPAPSRFNNPASKAEIESFEKRLGIRLPYSYKLFLEYTNGGMIMSDALNSLLKTENALEDVKWNANYLYSLEEVEKEYKEMESWNFGIPTENIATYPFIPFCHTATGEKLVFVTLSDDERESPILDAYHEETPETWGVVADNFTEFLTDYIQTHGQPNVLGELERGNALDLIEPMMEEKDKEESLETTIARITRKLEETPDDHWQIVLRGSAYKDFNEPEKALEDFNRAISLKDDKAYYYFLRGDLFRSIEKSRPALIDFDIAVKLEADDLLYLDSRASVLFEMGKVKASLKDVNKAIELDENGILAYMIRKSIYVYMGEDEKADADARKIEELQSKK